MFVDNVKISVYEMRNYLDYVRNSGKYKSEYIDVGFDGVEISTKLFLAIKREGTDLKLKVH